METQIQMLRCYRIALCLTFSLCFFAIPTNYTAMFSWAKAQGYTHRGTCNTATITLHLFSDNRSSIRKRQSPSQHNCVECCCNLQATPLSKLFVLFKLSRFAWKKKKISFMTLQWSALSYYHTALPVFCVCIWPRSEIPLTICYERGRDTESRKDVTEYEMCLECVKTNERNLLIPFVVVVFFFCYRRFLKEKVARSCRLFPRMRILWS